MLLQVKSVLQVMTVYDTVRRAKSSNARKAFDKVISILPWKVYSLINSALVFRKIFFPIQGLIYQQIVINPYFLTFIGELNFQERYLCAITLSALFTPVLIGVIFRRGRNKALLLGAEKKPG